MKTIKFLLLSALLIGTFVFAQQEPKQRGKKKERKSRKKEVVLKEQAPKIVEKKKPYAYDIAADPFAQKSYPWADSVFKTLSARERLGQLFMVAAYSNKDQKHIAEIDSLVATYKIGGLIFMQGGPMRQAQLTNRWQKMATVPLMLSMDAEWGLAMRLDSVNKFPKQMTLGALPGDSLIYQMGKEIALNCKRIGMQVNFAPVADVNNNPNNPVINTRSFGEDKLQVTQRALAYMRGMQDQKVLATAKHFPGHGDTDTDSHYGLPSINQNRTRLDSLELYPFKKLFKEGIGSVMVGHLFVPAFDTTFNLPSTLSAKTIKTLLKDELKFKGLVFTDALNMKGVANAYAPGDVDVKALIAGNDMLLFSENVPLAMQLIDSALYRGEISQAEIDEHCLKVLKAKEWTGLNKLKAVDYKNLVKDLNTPEAEKLNRQIKRQAITLLKNEAGIFPLKGNEKLACVVIGEEQSSVFEQTLLNYGNYAVFRLPKAPKDKQIKQLLDTLSYFDKALIAVINTNILAKKNFGFSEEGINAVNQIGNKKPSGLLLFANPYALLKLSDIAQFKGICVAYQDDEETQLEAVQILIGAEVPTGKLPVTLTSNYRIGMGLSYAKSNKIAYAHPEEMGFNSAKFSVVDSILQSGLKAEAYPGCQVMVLKNGKVVYERNLGYHDYSKKQKVSNQSVYDLASLTKVLATTAAVMKLVDEGKLNVNQTLGELVKQIPAGHPHAKILIKDAMLHQAGFPAWIPFYERFIKNDTIRAATFSKVLSPASPWEVAEGMCVSKAMKDSIFGVILEAKLNPAQGYKYSDLGFYYMREVVEYITKKNLEEYVMETYYQPMGLTTLGYLPLMRMSKDKIVPTEKDDLFRNQIVQGRVHDQGAALMGGVCGHAGLFGSAFDVAAMMQLFINDGVYGNKRYLKPETVLMFTKTFEANPSKNRRGLGFDKPVRDGSNGPTFNGISLKSFGHSGFTGTFAWADPEEDLVYVFLSNRVNPSATNNKLVKMGIRSEVQKAVYDALKK